MQNISRAALAAVAALTVIGPGLAGTVAQAAPTATKCEGEIQNRTIRGDLVVPDTPNRYSDVGYCRLSNVIVEGNVLVGENAGLYLWKGSVVAGDVNSTGDYPVIWVKENSLVRGNVNSTNGGGDLEIDQSRILGNIEAKNPGYNTITSSTVNGDYRGISDDPAYVSEGGVGDGVRWVDVSGSAVNGTMTVSNVKGADIPSQLDLENSTTAGDLTVDGVMSFGLTRSKIGGGLSVVNGNQPAAACDRSGVALRIVGSRVANDTAISNVEAGSCSDEYGKGDSPVKIGAQTSRMKKDGNHFGGNVDISDVKISATDGEQAPLIFSGNAVRGDLSGQGNDPAPTAERNRVHGDQSGQFAR